MATIGIRQTYARVKAQIASDKNRPVSSILADQDLRNDLRYLAVGLRALERSLNGRFEDVEITPIKPGEFTNNPGMKTVRAWTFGVWEKIPSKKKE